MIDERSQIQIDRVKRQAAEDKDLSELMATPLGRRVMWRVLERCGVEDPFTEDAARTAHTLGEQSIGRWLTKEFNRVCLSLRQQMEREQNGK